LKPLHSSRDRIAAFDQNRVKTARQIVATQVMQRRMAYQFGFARRDELTRRTVRIAGPLLNLEKHRNARRVLGDQIDFATANAVIASEYLQTRLLEMRGGQVLCPSAFEARGLEGSAWFGRLLSAGHAAIMTRGAG
jgi:hypothetical protein